MDLGRVRHREAPSIERAPKEIVELEEALDGIRGEVAKLIALESACRFSSLDTRLDLFP